MKTFWIFLFMLLSGVTILWGQTAGKEFSVAEDLFTNGQFADALPHYLNLLKADSSNADLNYKIGICYLNSRSQKAKAIYFLNKGKKFFEDINISTTARKVDSLQINLNGSSKISLDTTGNETTVAVSEDSQVILTYKDDNGNGNLYITILNGNQWTIPEKLDKATNSKGWESNECISADGNWLYFTSDRKGGFGGNDIYKSKKLPDGEWSTASNLGPAINTPYDDQAPFILHDGTVLYFSSNRYKIKGGYDVFTSRLADADTWTKPVNIGYPLNKIIDETVYPLTADNKPAQPSPIKETTRNEKDNYMFTFLSKKNPPVRVLKGKVLDHTGAVPKCVQITVTDNKTGDIISLYNPDSETGQYLFLLPPGKNNNITYEADGHLFHSQNIDLSQETSPNATHEVIKLLPVTPGSKIILNNVFFDPTTAVLRSTSIVELTRLVRLLNLHPNLVFEISGFMLSKENAQNNKTLSQQRAQAVLEYLNKKGISKDRIIAKGYVKSKSKTPDKKQSKTPIVQKKQIDEWVELNIIEKK